VTYIKIGENNACSSCNLFCIYDRMLLAAVSTNGEAPLLEAAWFNQDPAAYAPKRPLQDFGATGQRYRQRYPTLQPEKSH